MTKGNDSAFAKFYFPGNDAVYYTAKINYICPDNNALGSVCELPFPKQRNLCLGSGIIKEQL